MRIIANPLNAVNIANTIINLMANTKQYIQLSQNATKFAQQYTWEQSYCKPMFRKLRTDNKTIN